MLLTRPPICNVEKLEIPPYTIDDNQTETLFFAGKRNYHNIFIELEEGDQITFGQKHVHPLQIANYKFYGLFPLRWECRNPKVVECVVDFFEIV